MTNSSSFAKFFTWAKIFRVTLYFLVYTFLRHFWLRNVFHGLGLAPWSRLRRILLLRHPSIFQTIVYFQLCGNGLVKAFLVWTRQWQRRIELAFVEPWPQPTIQHLWNELECQLWARTYQPTSVLDLANAVVAEWDQNLVKSMKPRRVEAFIAVDCRSWFRMRCSEITYGCNVRVSIYLWSCSSYFTKVVIHIRH